MTSLPIWWDLYRYKPVHFHQCQRCVLHCHRQRQHRRWRRFRCRRAFWVQVLMTSLPIWWDLYRYKPVHFHQCQLCVLHCHRQRQHRRWRRFRCRRAFLVPYYVCVYHAGTNSKMLSPSEASSSHEAPSQWSGRPFCAFVHASAHHIFHPIYFAKA